MVQTGDFGTEDSGLNPRWPRNFIIVPRIRTVTNYKIEKLSVVTVDRTHNLLLPRLPYIPLVHPCSSHRRNKLYISMNHYCTERLAIFSHYQNPTSSSWETVIRISDPDCQIFQAWVTKTVFYVSRGIFAELFSQIHINWHCERKKSAGFVKTAFYCCGELLSKTILEVVDLVFF